MAAPDGSAYGSDHGLQVSLGTAVLPERVRRRTELPPGVAARQRIVPHVARVRASCTSER